MNLSIPDMSCGHCKATVERTVRTLDPGAVVEVDLAARTVRIEAGAAKDAILKALAAEGYPASETA